MLFLLREIALQWSSFTAEMKNQPGDKRFACKQASSSPGPWILQARSTGRHIFPSLPQKEQVPVDPFSWFTVEWVLWMSFQFSPHIDGRTILAALWENWLYKDLERETVYCLVPARMCNLHYVRGLQLCGLEFQPWLTSSWHEAQQPHSHSCFKGSLSLLLHLVAKESNANTIVFPWLPQREQL